MERDHFFLTAEEI